jgi:hypothetical protein
MPIAPPATAMLEPLGHPLDADHLLGAEQDRAAHRELPDRARAPDGDGVGRLDVALRRRLPAGREHVGQEQHLLVGERAVIDLRQHRRAGRRGGAGARAVGLAANGAQAVRADDQRRAGDWVDALKTEHEMTLAIFDKIEATDDSQTTQRSRAARQAQICAQQARAPGRECGLSGAAPGQSSRTTPTISATSMAM